MELPLTELLAKNVQAIAKKKGMRQPGMIDAGIKGGTAHRVTQGQNVKLSTLQKLASSFKVPAWQLLHPGFDPEVELLIVTKAEFDRAVDLKVEELSAAYFEWRRLRDEQARSDGRGVSKPYHPSPLEKGIEGSGGEGSPRTGQRSAAPDEESGQEPKKRRE